MKGGKPYDFRLLLIMFSALVFITCRQGSSTSNAADTHTALSTAVQWMSIQEAEAAMLREPKDIFIMVYAKWCPICKRFDETTYKDPKLVYDLNTKYYPVKLNAQTADDITYRSKLYANPSFDPTIPEDETNAYHELVYALQAGSIPSIVFLDKDFNRKGREMGYKPADELRSLLAMYQSQ